MEPKEFYELTGKIIDDCMKIMKSKGIAYSGVEDKFGNFKRIAKNLSMSPKQVWYVYFAKHLDSLTAYLRGEYSDNEPILGRIQDLINYLFLLYGMIVEEMKPNSDVVYFNGEPCGTCDAEGGDIIVTGDDPTDTGGDPTMKGKVKVTTNAPTDVENNWDEWDEKVEK